MPFPYHRLTYAFDTWSEAVDFATMAHWSSTTIIADHDDLRAIVYVRSRIEWESYLLAARGAPLQLPIHAIEREFGIK